MPHRSLDAFAKELLRLSGPDLVSWLTGERPLEIADVPSELLKAEKRSCDHLVRAILPRTRRPHYFHVEVQSEGDPEMGLRMLQYWVWIKRQFRKKERRPFTVSCFVLYLSHRRFAPDPGIIDEDDGIGTETWFRYRVLKLWELDPRTVLGLETPALAPLAPLMKCADPAELVIESLKKIEAGGARARKNDLRMALETFASLLIRDTRLLEAMVWEESMDLEETPAVRSWIRRGEKRGLQKGLQRGLRQGVRKGVQEGLLEARRGALLSVLSARFGRVKKDLQARILRIEDPALLEELIKRAAVAPSPSRFLEGIP